MKTRLKYYGIGFAIALTCMLIFDNIFVGGIVAFTIMMTAYLWVSIKRAKYRIGLLDEKCDPVAFLERTLEQKSITGTNKKVRTMHDMDIAAAYLVMGKTNDGLDLLLSLDKKYLSKKSGVRLVYTINLMEAYYALGENDKAEELYETEIPELSARGKHLSHAMEVLEAERCFFHNEYGPCREKIAVLLEKDIKLRLKLTLIYRLACMNEKEGKQNEALEQFREVAEKGNKLYIADMSKDQVMKLEKQI